MTKIYVRHRAVDINMRLPIPVIKRAIRETLLSEGVTEPCEVGVLITDNSAIHAINREHRGVDAPTDVLSFPLQAFIPGGFDADGAERDLATGLIPLGDIILSAEQVDKQARDYGHSRDRETAYLTVHSTLHLLGYDHLDEAEEKRRMRTCEDRVMSRLGYPV